MRRQLLTGLLMTLVLTVLLGVVYPLAMTGVAQVFMGHRADGSLVRTDGRVVGSSLVGQPYDLPSKKGQEAPEPDLKWFQGRPANGLGTNSVNTRYKLLLSGATNLAAENKDLVRQVEDAKAAVVEDNSVPGYTVRPSQVPADAVTSSGSGLDPDISPRYADLQVHRVADRNGLSVARVRQLVADHTEGRTLGFIGDPRVNVLQLNIALKALVARQ